MIFTMISKRILRRKKKNPSYSAILLMTEYKATLSSFCANRRCLQVPQCTARELTRAEPQGSHLGAVRVVKLVAQGILSICGDKT